MTVKPIPDGYTSVTPYLTVDDGKRAIEFYVRAFGAERQGKMATPDGKVAHAELRIGDAVVMLSDDLPHFQGAAPKALGGTTVSIFLYVEDVDALVRQAADAGATVLMEPEDQFWGDRMGVLSDPFGHVWLVATHMEEASPADFEARSQALVAGAS